MLGEQLYSVWSEEYERFRRSACELTERMYSSIGRKWVESRLSIKYHQKRSQRPRPVDKLQAAGCSMDLVHIECAQYSHSLSILRTGG